MSTKEYYQKNKESIKKKCKEYYQKNKDKWKEYNKCKKEYMKEYRNNPGVKAIEKEYAKIYKQRPESKLKMKGWDKNYYKKYPERVIARLNARYYLKHLKKPGHQFHHPDYSQPLLVEILPIAEHKALHVQLNLGENK